MKILIFCLPGIGDALMATPMIKVLKKEFPQVQIDAACMFEGVSYILKNNPYIDNVHFLKVYNQKKLLSVMRTTPLRKEKYDVSILAFPAYRREYHIVQWLAGANKRIVHTFGHGYLSELNFLDTDLLTLDEKEHHVINNLNLLKPLGIKWEKKYKKNDFKYELNLDERDIEFGRNYFKKLDWVKKNTIGIHPGSINSQAGVLKRWPIDRFAEVAKHLIKKKKKILVFVGPFELDLGKELFNLVDDKKNCRIVEKATFSQTLGVLNNINLLISNDNGFSHIANALNLKTITLFGPTNMRWCAPYNSKFTVNIRKSKSPTWFRNDMKVDNPPQDVVSGMESIKVSDVLEKI